MEVGKAVEKDRVYALRKGNLYSIFRENVDANRSQPLVIFHGKYASYYSLLPLVDSLAESLRRKFSVGKGDRVGIALPLSPQFFVSFLALQKIGAVAVPLDPELKSYELDNLNSIVHMKALFCRNTVPLSIGDGSGIEAVILTRIQDFLPFEKAVATTAVSLGRSSAASVSGNVKKAMFADLIYDVKGEEEEVDPDSDPSTILISPSRDGDLQAMVFTTSNLIASAFSISRTLPPLRGRYRIGTMLPPFLPQVFQFAVTLPIFLGGTAITALERYNYYKLFSSCSIYDCDYILASPHDLNRMIDRGVPNLAIKGLKGILCSSYLLREDVPVRMEKKYGIRVIEFYGIPEMAGVTHMQRSEQSRRKPGSPGSPIAEVSARIVDETTGEDLPQGSKGELLVMGPQLAADLFPKPSVETGYFRDGFFDSGDLAKVDEDGSYFIEDRRREAIVSSGILVSSMEIETVIAAVEGVKEVAVVGIDNGKGEEDILAVVAASPETQGMGPKILGACRKLLSSYKVPDRLEFRQELPKSLSGKILKRQIIEEHRASGSKTGQ